MSAIAMGTQSVASRRGHPGNARDTVERIIIRGNTHTRDRVIRRELGIAESQRIGDLDVARRRLEALGYFMMVTVAARPGSLPGLAAIDITVLERTQTPVGFSSVENFIGICAIRQN